MIPSELLRYRQNELKDLYASLSAPDTSMAVGVWRGTLMAFTGLDWLPRWFAALLYRLLALPINPWRGKGFAGAEGANRWFGMPGIGFGVYNLSVIDSPDDGQPILRLNYDRPDNLAIMRRIRGEGRLLGDGVMLCRMNWQTKSGLYPVLYFTLIRAN